MFQIKICGVTSVDDARHIEDAGADAIGLNFFPPSPRYVPILTAMKISEAMADSVCRVGLFVNTDPQQISEVAREVSLDLIQLHGNETSQHVADVAKKTNLPVLKAFRCRDSDLTSVLQFLQDQRSCQLDGVLLDAYSADQFGGTGIQLDAEKLVHQTGLLGELPWVLAGGLTDQNVGRAIRLLRPFGVDTASGVESAPGKKDAEKVKRFVQEAQKAFGEILP